MEEFHNLVCHTNKDIGFSVYWYYQIIFSVSAPLNLP